jgi:two-component system chemotaxis response regulator CheB
MERLLPSDRIMRTVEPRVLGGRYDIVAIASSAGGIKALIRLLGALPVGLPVPVLLVQHLDPQHRTVIADVLGRYVRLPVRLVREGELTVPGTVYIAPPNRHLLIGAGGRLTLSNTEPVHFLRPSADQFFESVAEAYGPRAVVCVLTGTGSDGAKGVRAVGSHGGVVMVQHPDDAEFRGMPEAAVETGAADFVIPLDEMAGLIQRLVGAAKP